jgi:hypothetical protein
MNITDNGHYLLILSPLRLNSTKNVTRLSRESKLELWEIKRDKDVLQATQDPKVILVVNVPIDHCWPLLTTLVEVVNWPRLTTCDHCGQCGQLTTLDHFWPHVTTVVIVVNWPLWTTFDHLWPLWSMWSIDHFGPLVTTLDHFSQVITFDHLWPLWSMWSIDHLWPLWTTLVKCDHFGPLVTTCG